MHMPTRGGTRGGQAEFSWDAVKQDKHREAYLGHSVSAPTGRWQKNKDVHWYHKDERNEDQGSGSDAAERRRQELRDIKMKEQEEIRRRLGGAPLPPSMTGVQPGSEPSIGSALASGSRPSHRANATSSTGANRSSLDPERARKWGNSGAEGGLSSEENEDEDDGSGLTKEERDFARKMAKKEAKQARHEEREKVREERRKRKEGRRYGDRDGHRSRSGQSPGRHSRSRSRSPERSRRRSPRSEDRYRRGDPYHEDGRRNRPGYHERADRQYEGSRRREGHDRR